MLRAGASAIGLRAASLALAQLPNRKNREKLAMIERLVAGGQPVPRGLITGEALPLPLPEERRRDIRRGITLLRWAIAVFLYAERADR